MEFDGVLFWIGHASFYIKQDKQTIFIDPFKISWGIKEHADIVLITHAHFDHCNKAEIKKVMKDDDVKIITAPMCFKENEFKDMTIAKPGFKTKINDIKIEAVSAYNTKPERLTFHPKANNWVGYIIEVNGIRIYHAGDTDFIPEMKTLKNLNISLLPAGGTYVMDADEAIEAGHALDSKFITPVHYKNLLGKDGSKALEEKFKKELHNALIMKEVQTPTYSF